MAQKKKIIIEASRSVGQRMAGPAIRSWEIAASLNKHFEVFLVTPNKPEFDHPGFNLIWKKDPALKSILKQCDGILTQGIAEVPLRIFLSTTPVLIDLYIPYWFELMEEEQNIRRNKAFPLNQFLMESRIKLLLKRGDRFICASEKQRYLWLGALAAMDRITSKVYEADRMGKALIDVVPFGIPEVVPEKTKMVLKGTVIRPDDKLILWNGGVWAWLDPFTLIKAVSEIAKHRDDVKLFFLGAHCPGLGHVSAEILDEAIRLTKELGLYSKTIFFNDSWIPYEERHHYLLEADVGVSLHGRSLESLFSFRTRLLDCIWTALPIVCAGGDYFGELVKDEGLGIVVKPEDVEGVKDGILRILDDTDFNRKCKENLKRVAVDFVWSKCVKPLEVFFDQPPPRKRNLFQNILLVLPYLIRILWGNLIYRLHLSPPIDS